jgi:hypothetical protein
MPFNTVSVGIRDLYVGVIGGLVGVILILMVTVGILLFKRKQGNKYV